MTPPNPDAPKDADQPPAPPIVEVDLSGELKGGAMSWADALKALENEGDAAGAAVARPAPKPAARKPAPAPPAPAPSAASTPAAEPAAQAAPPEAAAPQDAPARKPNRIEELMKKPSMTVPSEDLAVMTEMSNILSHVNAAYNAVQKFGTDHPYLVAPNILRMWEDNLKETSTVMMREFHNMRHGRQKKTYDKRCICNECHSVFMFPLPDGVCDECRHRPKDIQSGAY